MNRRTFSLAVTMRTPGNDLELAIGFLFTEHIIHRMTDVVKHRVMAENRLLLELDPDCFFDEEALKRYLYTSSSCGVCGKASLERVRLTVPYLLKPETPKLKSATVCRWPKVMQSRQSLFDQTGGIHAVGLFQQGEMLLVREDVGRHNAMDKLLGASLSQNTLPLDQLAVLVSGRASFELVQKDLMAGIPVLAALGAPSSLAIDLAADHNMTLIGFLKNSGFNVYSGAGRINGA
jgi:FdhD protein